MFGTRRAIPCATPYFAVEHEPARELVILRRSGKSFPTLSAIGMALASMRAVVDPLGARRVLVD